MEQTLRELAELKEIRHTQWCECGLTFDDCQGRQGEAWAAGVDDARNGTYDCRPYAQVFRWFNAYERGWRIVTQ